MPANVQVSTDGGVSWQDIWTRAGSGAPGQTSFTRYTNSLAAFAGREIRLRFAYTAGTGSYNVGAGTGTGWYLDDIQFRNTDQSTTVLVTELATNAFPYEPTNLGGYRISARPRITGRLFPTGPDKLIDVINVPAVVRITHLQKSGSNVQIDFSRLSGPASGFLLERTGDVGSTNAWATDPNASIQTIQPGSQYRALTSDNGISARFYRLRVLP